MSDYSDIKWIKYHPDEEQPPKHTPLLVTDGKVMFIGQLWGASEYHSQESWGEWGFGGYEWEWDELELEKMWDKITHWAHLPELPYEGI